LSLGLGALLLGYLLYHFRHLLSDGRFSPRAFWHSIKGAEPLHLLAAVLLIYICYFLRSIRWRNFQKYVGSSRLLTIFGMTVAGFSAVFLLGRVGEPVRPLLIARKEKIPLADTFGIYALERFVDIFFSVVILGSWFLVATVQKFLHPDQASPVLEGARKTAGTILTLGVVGLVALVLYVRTHGASMIEGRMQVWLAAHGWRASVARIVLGIARGLKTIRTWGDLAYALALSAAHWFLVILVYYLIALGFGGKLATLRFQDCMLILAMTLVGSLIQLPGIGGGPQAVMSGACTQLFGVPLEAALAASMVAYVISFASCTLAGIPILFREGWSLGDLRRMTQHEDEQIDAEISEPPAAPL
jgi:glycosyltransferase 2 family protein